VEANQVKHESHRESHPITSPIVIDNNSFDRTFSQLSVGTSHNAYAPETAGARMSTAFTAVSRDLTVAAALNEVRAQAKTAQNIYTVYVVGPNFRLDGVVSLRELIVAHPDELVAGVMTSPAMCVTTDTDQERVVRVFQELDSISVPVVDAEERLVGIVTVDDALDVQADEATEDAYGEAGIANKEAARSDLLVSGNLWDIWKVRLPFLMITLGAGMLAGLVVEGFEAALSSVVAVAVFIPLIMDMGGNVGSQSSTIFARGVVLGHISVKNFWNHFFKEIFIGFTIGALVGILGGLVAGVWQGLPGLGLAVGLALTVTVTLSAALGFIVPWALVRIGADQAAGAAPIITSIKDISGLLIYFGFVTLFLSHML
jgi:magnesium transporter